MGSMSSSKINNNFNIANAQNTLPSRNLRSFKAADNFDNFPDSFDDNETNKVRINKFSNEDIYALSTYAPDKKMSKVAANSLKTIFVTIPVIDTVVAAAIKNGGLSSKLKAGAGNALRWGSVFAAGFAVMGTKSAINSKLKPLDDFDNKHPVLATIIDFSAIYTAWDLLNKGTQTAVSSVKELLPNFTQKLNKNVYNPVKEFLNNSLLNKKIILPAEKFVEKRPYLGNANKFSAMMLVPAMVTASLIRYNKELKNRNEQVERNMQLLNEINDSIPDEVIE